MLDQAMGALSHDVAIDLGTSNTRVLVRGRGIVVDEPSGVAVERQGTAQRVFPMAALAADNRASAT